MENEVFSPKEFGDFCEPCEKYAELLGKNDDAFDRRNGYGPSYEEYWPV